MIIVSIDIETTGLEKELDQILSVGVVIENTKDLKPLEQLPQLHIIIPRERISGNPFALNMNKELIERMKWFSTLSKEQKDTSQGRSIQENAWFVHEGMVSTWIYRFLLEHGFEQKEGQIHLNVLGKNFGTFDKLFLEKLPNWSNYIKIRQRILDPAMLNIDWENDESLPNLKTCMDRSGFDSSRVVTHDALQDALDTLEVLRKSTNNYLGFNKCKC